jgi:uncharacterized protein YndB with AHSA1/START domain
MAKLTVTAEPGTPFIETTRDFAATPEVLFRAWTEPELVARWLGPRDHTMDIAEYDVRHGGRWAYGGASEQGSFGFRGVFHGEPSVEAGILQTFEFDGWPGHVSLDRVTFEPHGDTTTVRTWTVFQSVADRDGMIESGMEGGMAEGYDKLDELLPELRDS